MERADFSQDVLLELVRLNSVGKAYQKSSPGRFTLLACRSVCSNQYRHKFKVLKRKEETLMDAEMLEEVAGPQCTLSDISLQSDIRLFLESLAGDLKKRGREDLSFYCLALMGAQDTESLRDVFLARGRAISDKWLAVQLMSLRKELRAKGEIPQGSWVKELTCQHCQETFQLESSTSHRGKFCSLDCYHASRKAPFQTDPNNEDHS